MDPHRKKLIFRAHYMGTNENDTLFGAFAEQYVKEMSPQELSWFQALLEEQDPDLFDWISGRKPVPEHHKNSVFEKLKNFTISP